MKKMNLFLLIGVFFSILFYSQIPKEEWVRIGKSYSGCVTAVAVSPSYDQDQTLFIGVEDVGLLISTNRGETWSMCPAISVGKTITQIALPKNYRFGTSSQIFVTTSDGCFYSSIDEFSTIQYSYRFLNPTSQNVFPATAIVLGGVNNFDGNIFVGTWGYGVWWNNMYGQPDYWTAISLEYRGLDYVYSLAISNDSNQYLFASSNPNNNNLSPIYRYGGGQTWYSIAPSYLIGEETPALLVSQKVPNLIFAGTKTKGMWYSGNNGSTWNTLCDGSVTGGIGYIVKKIKESPNFDNDGELWEGTSLSLRISYDRGASCEDSFPFSEINDIAFSPSYNSGNGYCDVFIATNSALFKISCDDATKAVSRPTVDGRCVAIAKGGYGVFLGSSTRGLFKCVSLNSPRQMVEYNNFPNGLIPEIVAICLHPNYDERGLDCSDQKTLFVAANFYDSTVRTRSVLVDSGVYKSVDGGNTWIKLTGGDWPTTPPLIRDLAISPNFVNDGTLFVTTKTDIYRWDGGNVYWRRVATDNDFVEFSFVALPPQYNKNSTCSYGGYSGLPCNLVFVGAKRSGDTDFYLAVSYNNGEYFYQKPLKNPTGVSVPRNYCNGSSPSTLCVVSSSTEGVSVTNSITFSTWVKKNNGLPASSDGKVYVSDIVGDPFWVDPSTSDCINISLPFWDGIANISNVRVGIYKTSDINNWTFIKRGSALSIATEPYGDGSKVVAGFKMYPQLASFGALYSTNFSWSSYYLFSNYTSLPVDIFSTVAHERDPNIIFAASPSMGVFVSTNKGESFKPYNEGFGSSTGPCFLTEAYAITMLANRKDLNYDVIYVSTKNGIKSRYIYYDPISKKIDLYHQDPQGNPSKWRHSLLSNGTPTTGYWERLEVVPNSSKNYPIWAIGPSFGSIPAQGFLSLPAGSYEGWIYQNNGLPPNPEVKGVRIGYSLTSEPQQLISGSPIKRSVAQGEWDYYYIDVLDDTVDLYVQLDDVDDLGPQDADVYIRFGALPTLSSYDYRPYINGDESVCIKSILFENFNGDWGPYGNNPPRDWTILDYGSENPQVWNENDWYKFQNGSYGYSAKVSYYPPENQLEYLISSSFNIPSTLTSVTLDYDHYFAPYNNDGENGQVMFKSDQLGSWYVLKTYTTNTGGMVHETLDLTAYRGHTNCQICFKYQANDDLFWIVDNVRVSGKSPQKLKKGRWYIGVRGYANVQNGYILTATLNSGCQSNYREESPGLGKDVSLLNFIKEPEAPTGGTIWGTIWGSGVVKGEGTSTVNWTYTTSQPSNTNVKTIIQLPDSTLIVGCDASSSSDKGIYYSPAGDVGETTWIEAHSVASEGSKNYVDIISAPNGDVLIAANGSGSSPGGVWLSGDKGKNWMNISYGFDSNTQELEDLVADCGDSVSYYASTDSTGLYTRTITANPYPTVTSIYPNSGSSFGGTLVTITGTNFFNSCPTGNSNDCPHLNPIVIFGTNEGTTEYEVEATWISSTQLSAITPPHPPGLITVKVRNPDTRESKGGVNFNYIDSCAPPSGFPNNSATDNNGCLDEGVKIEWSIPTDWGDGGIGTRTFEVLRNGIVIASGLPETTTSYIDITGNNNQIYNYQVRANNGCGQSTTTTGSAVGDFLTPTTPTITSIEDIDNCSTSGIRITWTDSENASEYDLMIDNSFVISSVSSPYNYEPQDNNIHSFKIRGKNLLCYGSWSNSVNGSDVNNTPQSPVITSIIDIDPNSLSGIIINFTLTDATSYDLYKDGNLVVLNFTSGQTYYPNDSLEHYYVIKANKEGCSSYSVPVSGTDQTASSPPLEIGSSCPSECVFISSSSIISWNSEPTASGYKIYRLVYEDLPNLLNSNSEGCYRDVGNTTSYSLSLDDPSAEQQRVYYYIITGYNGAGEGSAGNGRDLSSNTLCN